MSSLKNPAQKKIYTFKNKSEYYYPISDNGWLPDFSKKFNEKHHENNQEMDNKW